MFPGANGNVVYGNAFNCASVIGTIATGAWYPNIPYIATQSLVIESGSALTLRPNTVVKFVANASLIVRGALVASTTVDSPIVFTALKDDDYPSAPGSYGADTQQDGGATKPVATTGARSTSPPSATTPPRS